MTKRQKKNQQQLSVIINTLLKWSFILWQKNQESTSVTNHPKYIIKVKFHHSTMKFHDQNVEFEILSVKPEC